MARGARRLTARQLQVIDLLSRPGATATSVAEDLGLSTQTVKNHLQAAYLNLGVRSFGQAVRAVRLRTPIH